MLMTKALACCAAFVLLSASARADVLVQQVWVRSTPTAARGSSAYATIINTSAKADRLMEVSSPDADKVELKTSTVDGIRTQATLAQTLPVPAKATLELKPGASHVVMTGLTRPLRAGETLSLTFSFEFFGDVDVEAMVAPLAAQYYPGPKPAP